MAVGQSPSNLSGNLVGNKIVAHSDAFQWIGQEPLQDDKSNI